MTTTAKLMNIRIKAGATGVFFATSEDDPTFFLTATSAAQLWAAIPHALEDLFRARDLDYVAMARLSRIQSLRLFGLAFSVSRFAF